MSTWIPIYVVELDRSSSSTRSDIRIRSTSCPEFRFIILPIPCPSTSTGHWLFSVHLIPSFSSFWGYTSVHNFIWELNYHFPCHPALYLSIYIFSPPSIYSTSSLPHTDWLLSLHVCWSVSLSPWGHDCNTHRIPYYPYFCIPLSWLVSLSRAIWCGNWVIITMSWWWFYVCHLFHPLYPLSAYTRMNEWNCERNEYCQIFCTKRINWTVP